jgi:hypothetical protein
MSLFGAKSTTEGDKNLIPRLAIALPELLHSPMENKGKIETIKAEFQKIVANSLKSEKGGAPQPNSLLSFFFINAIEINESLFNFNKENKGARNSSTARSVASPSAPGPSPAVLAFTNEMDKRVAAVHGTVKSVTAATPSLQNNLKKRLAALKTAPVEPAPNSPQGKAQVLIHKIEDFRAMSESITQELLGTMFAKGSKGITDIMVAKQFIIRNINRGIINMNATGFSNIKELVARGGRRKSTRRHKSTRKSKRSSKKTRRH